MEKDNGEDEMNGSINTGDTEQDMSFVKKVSSRVSGLFNSSISRLFGSQERQPSTVRRRESDDFCESQPPRKRAKQSENNFTHNTYTDSYIPNQTSNLNDINNRSSVFTDFVEPIAGTSGIRAQKVPNKRFTSPLFTDLSCDKYSESGESTSGYSSMPRMRQKSQTSNDNPDSTPFVKDKPGGNRKLFDTPETQNTTERSLFSDQSLFADRSLSPQAKNTSLSSRRPSFNASSFGSPNFVDRTITTSRIVNSPFYNGPTTFGGASAYDRTSGLNDLQRNRIKSTFVIKPVIKKAESSSTSLSKTARRILDSLEQYSMPLSDVKKIPLPAKGKQGLLTPYLGANPYKMRQTKDSSRNNKELLVPTTPELLKMKERLRFQETTENIRKIASASTSKTDEYKIEENQQKHTNKMRNKIVSVRDKAPAVQIIDNVVLQPIPLTIPENKLPKFDLKISISLTNNNEVNESKTVVENKVVEKITPILPKTSECSAKVDDFASNFVFSSPLVIADNLKSIVPINNFKFSEPLCKKVIERNNKTTKKVDNKINNGDISAQNSMDCSKSKPTDPLMERFKPPAGSWECSTCLIQNKPEAIKCVACETLRLKETPKTKPILPSFGAQFNKKADEWECTCCMVRNKVTSDKCVACTSSRPSTIKTNGFGDQFKKSADEWECQTCLIRNKKDATKCAACETSKDPPKSSSFGDKFKPPSGTWECQTCLIRNKNEVDKCAACETKRTLSSNTNQKSTTWECDTCLIRNKIELKQCAACKTPKDKNISVNSEPLLKKSTDKWECPTCLVWNNNDVEKCPCCETSKPGATKKSDVNLFNFGVTKSEFTFGIPKDVKQQSAPIATTMFNFGAKTDVKENNIDKIVPESKSTPTFSFGIPKTDNKDSQLKTPTIINVESNNKTPTISTTVTPTFKFGNPSTTTSQSNVTENKSGFKFDSTKPLLPPTETLQPKTIPSTENKLSSSTSKSEVFSFGSTNAAPPPFSFGKTGNSEPAKPTFDFVAGPSSTSAVESKRIDFGTQKTDAEFSFNSSKPATNLFPPAGSAPKNGGFNFGNNPVVNNNRSAVFSFGATQNLPQTADTATTANPPAQPKSFNFPAPAAPSGGFNFSAPTFDSNIKPSFNFTGGNIPTFAATPSDGGGAPPVRKFKKAVRRTAQR